MARADEQSAAPGGQDVTDRRDGGDQRPAFAAPADRPRPYSHGDLCQRLERLPRGHPSSPRNADGSRKPPPPRLRDLELPLPGEESSGPAGESPDPRLQPMAESDGWTERARDASPGQREAGPARIEPLTDAEHAEHVRYVAERLDQARREGLATDQQHLVDSERGIWSDERSRLHYEILDDLYASAADVSCERAAVMAGGLAGAGKSTVLKEHAGIDGSQYLTINPDDIKEELAARGLIPHVDGLTPMEASDLVHEESSYLAKRLARRAMEDGKNVKWDITMASKPSTERKLIDLEKAAYTVTGIFVDISIEEGVRRAEDRYRRGHEDYRNGAGYGGRYVPPEVIRSQADPEWGSANRRTFEQLKESFDEWAVYDNSAPVRAPVLVRSDRMAEKFRREE